MPHRSTDSVTQEEVYRRSLLIFHLEQRRKLQVQFLPIVMRLNNPAVLRTGIRNEQHLCALLDFEQNQSILYSGLLAGCGVASKYCA